MGLRSIGVVAASLILNQEVTGSIPVSSTIKTMGEKLRAGLVVIGWGKGPPITQDEVELWHAAQKRLSAILQTYWAAHGRPESLAEQATQAIRLYQEFYPPGYPRPAERQQ